MPSSGIIDLAIGMAFVFGVTAALASVVTELIARFFGLRGEYLLRGLRELLDGGKAETVLANAEEDYKALTDFIKGQGTAIPASATGALLGSPILRSQGMAGEITSRDLTVPPARPPAAPASPATPAGQAAAAAQPEERPKEPGFITRKRKSWQDRRSLPSYIPARSFAEAIIDLVVPDATGKTSIDELATYLGKLPPELSTLKLSLQALVKHAGGDINTFRTSVEHWYDDHMDRVSGWYKRHVAKITLVVGATLVLLLNVNALTIGRTLYSDGTVRAAVSTVAAKVTSCPANQSQQDCLSSLHGQLSAAAKAGLPIGWGTVADCAAPATACNWWDQRGIFSRHGGSAWQVVLVLIGFLITITALVPGARFWFNLLSKLGSLRSTGPKPATPAS